MADEDVELSNVFEGHILPRRMKGDVETVSIALFNPDGSPFELPTIPEPPELEGWQYVSDFDMQNGWHSLSTDHQLRFRKRTDKVVEFFGYLAPGVDGLVFYLPESCRPLNTGAGHLMWACPTPDGTLKVGVKDDGGVSVLTAPGGVTWVNLAPLRFSTD